MNFLNLARPDPLAEAAMARLAEVTAATLARMPVTSLRHAARGKAPAARTRQTAMYLAHVVFGLSLTRVGISFGRDRTTVRHACRLVEETRDDARVEFGLSATEAGLLALSRALRSAGQEG